MRSILTTILALFLTLPVLSQNLNEQEVDTTYKDTTSIVDVDILPEFPGGLKKMYKHIDKQFEEEDTTCMGAVVYIKFIVDRKGVIRDPYVTRGYSDQCDEIALSIVEGMPKWKPGKQGREEVNCWHTVPILFPSEEDWHFNP